MRQAFAVLALAALVAPAAGCRRDEPLNLIVVVVDTLRADHLGYAGYSRPVSARIDAVARESVVLANHYSAASRTGPSVASIFTGLYPRSHGVLNPLDRWDAKGTLGDDRAETLAEILTDHGYDCRGYVANLNVGPRLGFAQGFEEYLYLPDESARALNDAAFDAIDESKRPFFLYLHYLEPHSPYDAPPPFDVSYVDGSYRGPITGGHAQLDEIVAGRIRVHRDDVEQLRALYAQEIRYFDDHFGELIRHLEETSLLDDTLLVFTSDHGEEFLDHGSVLHGYTLYEEQLRVPCFVRDPRREGGARIEQTTRHVDLLPTLLELLGLPAEASVQGTSFAAALDGEALDEARPVFAQASLRAVKTVRLRSLTRSNWKLIETILPQPGVELYHLATDPGERNDLSAASPEMVRDMQQRLDEMLEGMPVAEGPGVTLDEAQIERLRAMGYLD